MACAGGLFTVSRWPFGLCSAGPAAARLPPAGPVPGVGLRGNLRALIPSSRRPLSLGTGEFRAARDGGRGGRAQSVTASGLWLRTRPGPGAWKLPRRFLLPGPWPRGEWGLLHLGSHSPHRAETQTVHLVNPPPQVRFQKLDHSGSCG